MVNDMNRSSIKTTIIRRLGRIFSWFLWGGLIGAIIGAIGGIFDRGSMMILLPSGSVFWSIIGAFFGSIAGALYGAFSRIPSPDVRSINPERSAEEVEALQKQQR
jgi:hypothetical protein